MKDYEFATRISKSELSPLELFKDFSSKSAPYDDNLYASLWPDKPVGHHSRHTDDDGSKHCRPEAIDDKAGNQQGSKSQHGPIENQ
jgi:hypothetical protein